MNRSRVVSLVSLLLLLAVGYWVMVNTQWVERTTHGPLKGEAQSDPFYAARFLAKELGATAVTLRRMQSPPAGKGTLVLSSAYWNLFDQDGSALQAWVHSGGHLVVDADLLTDEGLDWIKVSRKWKPREDEATRTGDSGDRSRSAKSEAAAGARDPPCIELKIRVPATSSVPIDSQAGICNSLYSYLLPESTPDWSLESPLGAQALRYREGEGRVTIYNASEVLIHRQPMKLAHAWYFVLITDLKPGDALWFVPFEDSPPLPVLIWKHGAAVVITLLLAVGAALWRAAPRFGPPMAQTIAVRRSLRDQIVGSGTFVGRADGGATLLQAQVQALEHSARRCIAGYDALASEDRVATLARICDLPAAQLAHAILPEKVRAATLGQHLTTLESARRRLNQSITHSHS